MKYSFNGDCCFCLHSGDDLLQCSECEGLFHDQQCGKLPTETEYERADPDDLLRGMSFAGKREIPKYKSAKCGNCLKFSDERKRFVQTVLPSEMEHLAQLKAEMQLVDREIKRQDDKIDLLLEEADTTESVALELRSELEEERNWWRHLDRAARSKEATISDAARQFQSITVELGQALAYQEYQVSAKLDSQKQKLEAAEEDLAKIESEQQRLSEAIRNSQAIINRYIRPSNSDHNIGSSVGFYTSKPLRRASRRLSG